MRCPRCGYEIPNPDIHPVLWLGFHPQQSRITSKKLVKGTRWLRVGYHIVTGNEKRLLVRWYKLNKQDISIYPRYHWVRLFRPNDDCEYEQHILVGPRLNQRDLLYFDVSVSERLVVRRRNLSCCESGFGKGPLD
jgi:hypothetical protein